MAENPGDLSLPLSVVSRIISDALPENTSVSIETRKAIAKAASVFVLYATASAAGMAAKRNRKTTNANDVLDGIVEMEFTQFSGPLKKAFENYKQNLKKKPTKPANAKKGDDEVSEQPKTSSPGQANTSTSNSKSKSGSPATTPGSKKGANASAAAAAAAAASIELVTITDSDSSSV